MEKNMNKFPGMLSDIDIRNCFGDEIKIYTNYKEGEFIFDLNCNDFKIRYAMGGSIRPPYSFNSVRSFGLNCIFPHNRCTLFFIGHTTHSPSIFPALIFISVCVRSL